MSFLKNNEHPVYSALIGGLPSETLYRLPEWCTYIETPGKPDAQLGGISAHLKWDANTGRNELRSGFIPAAV